jgi:predicted GNAT superfamily acetyltransferase
MLAVKTHYRGENLGFLLKLAQRDRALAQGIKVVTWTFDPLQSLNAHLNIEKLGVVAVKYKVDFYGETSSSLHRDIGTDRLWVRWDLESDRVKRTLEGQKRSRSNLENMTCLVACDSDGMPKVNQSELPLDQDFVIEIPGDIGALMKSQPDCAVQWRRSTREPFLKAFEAGFFVAEFQRRQGPVGPLGAFILTSVRSN